MNPSEVIIDPEFQSLCQRQTDEELELLEASLVQYGCMNPIIVREGHNTVLDGNTRIGICRRLGIPFEIKTIALESREAAIEWIIDHQLGKRNLTDFQKRYLRGKKYNQQKVPVGKTSPNGALGGKLLDEETAVRLGKTFGVSRGTVCRDGALAKSVDAIVAADSSLKSELFENARWGKPSHDDLIAIAELPKESIPSAVRNLLAGAAVKNAADDFDAELERRAIHNLLRVRLRKLPEEQTLWFCDVLEEFAKKTARGHARGKR